MLVLTRLAGRWINLLAVRVSVLWPALHLWWELDPIDTVAPGVCYCAGLCACSHLSLSCAAFWKLVKQVAFESNARLVVTADA